MNSSDSASCFGACRNYFWQTNLHASISLPILREDSKGASSMQKKETSNVWVCQIIISIEVHWTNHSWAFWWSFNLITFSSTFFNLQKPIGGTIDVLRYSGQTLKVGIFLSSIKLWAQVTIVVQPVWLSSSCRSILFYSNFMECRGTFFAEILKSFTSVNDCCWFCTNMSIHL